MDSIYIKLCNGIMVLMVWRRGAYNYLLHYLLHHCRGAVHHHRGRRGTLKARSTHYTTIIDSNNYDQTPIFTTQERGSFCCTILYENMNTSRVSFNLKSVITTDKRQSIVHLNYVNDIVFNDKSMKTFPTLAIKVKIKDRTSNKTLTENSNIFDTKI